MRKIESVKELRSRFEGIIRNRGVSLSKKERDDLFEKFLTHPSPKARREAGDMLDLLALLNILGPKDFVRVLPGSVLA